MISHPSYDVLIRRNETGEVRQIAFGAPWTDWSLYLWTENTYACDCNRAMFFDPEEEWTCGMEDFTVIKAIFPDGSELPIDDPEETENSF